MSTASETVTLNYNTDFTARFDVDQYVAGTGWTSATGTTGWQIRIAASRTGSAIGGLSATASEEGSTGVFAASFDQGDLQSALTTYKGRYVYVILSKTGDVDGLFQQVLVTDSTAVA